MNLSSNSFWCSRNFLLSYKVLKGSKFLDLSQVKKRRNSKTNLQEGKYLSYQLQGQRNCSVSLESLRVSLP